MAESRKKPRVLYIDDDESQRALVHKFLSTSYDLFTAEEGAKGLEMASKISPDLILLDINMPGMDGYEVCSRLQSNEETAYIPVIFLTAMGDEQNRARAFSVGAADFLVKPVDRKLLAEKVDAHIVTKSSWKALKQERETWYERVQSSDFLGFKEYVAAQVELDAEGKYRLSKAAPEELYKVAAELGIEEAVMSRFIAKYLGLSYVSGIDPDSIRLGAMPTAFCRANKVVPVTNPDGSGGFIICNPFNVDLVQTLMKFSDRDRIADITITEPGKIDAFFTNVPSVEPVTAARKATVQPSVYTKRVLEENAVQNLSVAKIADTIINAAVSERASDIHIEPKENSTIVRFRIDGDLRHAFTLKKNTGVMVISRLKTQAGMDISEKRKPQDGGFATKLGERVFNLRLSTTSTPNGESLVMRLLEPYARPKKLEELGMSEKQAQTMAAAAARSSGMILVVGATGSGKTTTIYSLLHNIDYKRRSIMSVEDPVEYRMPFVNQQQVNEKAGVTFEALLRASVRQDPDVLFLGEVRDGFSAKMAIDFASTGHLTITTMHTSNATTAIFRLERLGIDRGIMADTVIAVVAQKLIKKLCPNCKKETPISQEEAEMLAPFTSEIPDVVAHPVGCPECRNTGYSGREGVYEVLEFDSHIAEMVRAGEPISRIRAFLRQRGDFLISTHAISKVRDLVFAPADIFEKALAEEETLVAKPAAVPDATVMPDTGRHDDDSGLERPISILLVDDDDDTRKLIRRFLETEGYDVTECADGIDALLCLGKKHVDLVISDINMPNLDGFKLLEMVSQKGVESPVILLTSSTETTYEEKGLGLGAADFLRKPVKREVLSLRVKKALGRARGR